MADAPRPKLEVVEGGGETTAAKAPEPPEGARSGRPWLAWILALLLAASAVALVNQQQRTVALEAEITGLTGELRAAEAALGSHRRHLNDVRSAVSDLEALVQRDPEAAPGR